MFPAIRAVLTKPSLLPNAQKNLCASAESWSTPTRFRPLYQLCPAAAAAGC